MVTAAMKLKDPCSWKESYDNPTDDSKKQRHHFANKGPYSQSSGFSSSHIQMRELDHKRGWMPKNWCFWTVVQKTLQSLLDCEETKPVNPKGNKSCIFTGRTDAEAPILWFEGPSHWKGLSLERLMLGKIKVQRRRGSQRMRWIDTNTDSMNMNSRKLREIGKEREAWSATVYGVAKSWTWLSDCTTLQCNFFEGWCILIFIIYWSIVD